MRTTVHAVFSLQGYFDPQQATLVLELQPTVSYVRGSAHRGVIRDHSLWSLATPDTESLDLPAQVMMLVDLLEPKKAQLIELLADPHVAGTISAIAHVNTEDSTPSAYFGVQLLRSLVDLDLALDVDLYLA